MEPCEIFVQLTATFVGLQEQIESSSINKNSTPPKSYSKKFVKNLEKCQNQEFLKFDKNQLYSLISNKVPGRKSESLSLCDYIESLLYLPQGPLCLSGSTGCGKTSLINLLTQEIQNFSQFQIVYINCIQAISPKKIYSIMLQSLYQKKSKKPQNLLQKLITQESDGRIKIVVLDEIDQFTNKKGFIYNILQWCQSSKQPFGLILISNMVDLTERLANKLRSRMKFNQIIFKPYSYMTLKEILKYKFPKIFQKFDDDAITFLCKKIAAEKSDVRILERCFIQIAQDCTNKDKKKIHISDIQSQSENEFPEIQNILLPYKFILEILMKALKGTNITNEIKAQFRVNYGQNLSDRQILYMLMDLRDFKLIDIKQEQQNCEIKYENWGINLTGFFNVLHART